MWTRLHHWLVQNSLDYPGEVQWSRSAGSSYMLCPVSSCEAESNSVIVCHAKCWTFSQFRRLRQSLRNDSTLTLSLCERSIWLLNSVQSADCFVTLSPSSYVVKQTTIDVPLMQCRVLSVDAPQDQCCLHCTATKQDVPRENTKLFQAITAPLTLHAEGQRYIG